LVRRRSQKSPAHCRMCPRDAEDKFAKSKKGRCPVEPSTKSQRRRPGPPGSPAPHRRPATPHPRSPIYRTATLPSWRGSNHAGGATKAAPPLGTTLRHRARRCPPSGAAASRRVCGVEQTAARRGHGTAAKGNGAVHRSKSRGAPAGPAWPTPHPVRSRSGACTRRSGMPCLRPPAAAQTPPRRAQPRLRSPSAAAQSALSAAPTE
jgi:hypothetical protein